MTSSKFIKWDIYDPLDPNIIKDKPVVRLFQEEYQKVLVYQDQNFIWNEFISTLDAAFKKSMKEINVIIVYSNLELELRPQTTLFGAFELAFSVMCSESHKTSLLFSCYKSFMNNALEEYKHPKTINKIEELIIHYNKIIELHKEMASHAESTAQKLKKELSKEVKNMQNVKRTKLETDVNT